MKKIQKKAESGITLIALVITIIVLIILASISIGALTGKNGIINNSKFAKFSAQIKQYQSELDDYVIQQELLKGGKDEIIIYESDLEEIKKIITTMTDEDAEKYVIQENEIRYNPDAVDNQEKEWLAEIGVIAMVAVYAITFMNKGEVYKTIYSDKITFPLINPTSRDGNFAGWYYDEETTNEAEQGDELVQDITLYARYKAREIFTITFMANGSVFAEIQGDEIVYPETNPVNEQGDMFTFSGWYRYDEAGLTEDGNVGNGTKVTKDTILYAGWKVTLEFFSTNDVSICLEKIKEEYIIDILQDDELLQFIKEAFKINIENPEEVMQLKNDIEADKITIEDVLVEYMKNNNKYTRNDKIILTFKYPQNIIKYELKEVSMSAIIKDKPTDPVIDISNSISMDENGIVEINASYLLLKGTMKVKVTYSNGNEDILVININQEFVCLAEGTEITLANRTKKNIEDIVYEDELLVWDFDNGCFASAKPLWIKKSQLDTQYNYIKFEDGTELRTVIDHRIFNMEAQKFTYTMNEEDTPIGTTVFKEDGTVTKLIERKIVREKVNYYNVITDYHMNLFANGILTSLRLNNLYEIKDMKFIKDNRKLTPREDFKNIPDKYFYGLRLAEQPKEINRGNDVKHTRTLEEYVERLLRLAK